jgi:hypothetical protein
MRTRCLCQVVYLGGQPYAVMDAGDSQSLARDWASYGSYSPAGDATLRGTQAYPGSYNRDWASYGNFAPGAGGPPLRGTNEYPGSYNRDWGTYGNYSLASFQ